MTIYFGCDYTDINWFANLINDLRGIILNFQVVITQIMALFMLIGVGYFLRKNKYLNNQDTSTISRIVIDVILPAQLISALQINITDKMFENFISLFFYWIIFYFFLVIFSYFFSNLIPISKNKKNVFKFSLIFGNVGYMGLPIIGKIFPESGIFFGSVGLVVFNILLWTYGINLFMQKNLNKNSNLRNIFNNGFIAIIIGLFFMLTNLRIPTPLMNALNMLGDAVFPLAMVVIGSSLASIKISGIFTDISIIIYSILKLLLIPLGVLIILKQFNVVDPIKSILVLQTAMPAAAVGVIFAERYEGNYVFAAETLFLSTLSAAFSIPIIYYLINFI